jgi:putative addiction module killer protein
MIINRSMKLAIREYLTPQGKNPFREWLKTLDMGVQARIQARVLRFENGNLGDHKNVGGGVWEARLDFGPGYRLYFGKDGVAVILLLAGGDKTLGRRNMARRSKDWNVGLAQDLRDPNFAREFLLAAIEEGVSIQIALGKVIRAIGIKEFSARIKIASPNILRAINPRHNPTQETLNRLLKPFRLKLSLAPIEQPKSRHAA